MSDLVAFLRARLGEDEAGAREAADGDSGQWFMGDKWNVYRAEDEARYDLEPGPDEHRLVVYGNVEPQSEHIARHDPARVLREVEAGRAILAEHQPVWDDYVDGDGIERATHECETCRPPGTPDNWPCQTIRALAAVWSDHPDYDPAWRLGPPAPPDGGRPGGEQQHRDHGDENTQHDRPV